MSIVGCRRGQGVLREHLAIIDALRTANVNRAEQLMVRHVRRVREAIVRLVT
jgi:DNA-binding GntR family transcriptional regulator